MGTMSSTDIIQVKEPREASNVADAIAHETATTMISELANSSRAAAEARSLPALQPQPIGGEIAPNAIFSSIGLGIVNDFAVESEDATEAAFKAVQDAIERGGLGITVLKNLVLSVRVGVPGRAKQPNLPMHVDVAHLTPLVPPTVSLSRLEVVIGGLLSPVSSTQAGQGGICSAVACLSFFQQGDPISKHFKNEGPLGSISSVCIGDATRALAGKGVDGSSSIREAEHGFTRPIQPIGPSSGVLHKSQQFTLGSEQEPRVHSIPNPKTFHRATSMEMLARISAEIRDQQPSSGEDPRLAGAHNYKKLPPGKTPKNNKRLFVQHKYRDYSEEVPISGEECLARPDAPLRTPNAAFPLKLHETLTIIENDGLDHVIGWMPHGRSFKIHKHQEFVDEILPKYFV